MGELYTLADIEKTEALRQEKRDYAQAHKFNDFKTSVLLNVGLLDRRREKFESAEYTVAVLTEALEHTYRCDGFVVGEVDDMDGACPECEKAGVLLNCMAG